MRLVKTSPKKLFFWLTLIGLFFLGLGLVRLTANAVYDHVSAAADMPQNLDGFTKARVARRTDAVKLVNAGQKLLGQNMAEFAAYYFARASELDPNWRDAAYGWGYSVIAGRGGQLGEDDVKQVETAIVRVERVDPFYQPMLELKRALAESRHDQATIDAVNRRLELLDKSRK